MERWKISLAVVCAVMAFLVYVVPSVVLVAFSGMLVAALLDGGGREIGRRLNIGRGWGIATVVVLIIGGFTAVSGFAATAIIGQFNELVSELPNAVESVRERISDYDWAESLLDRANPEGLLGGEGSRMASGAVSSTFGALGNLVVILFIGLYIAINPGLYRRGAVSLFAPSLQPRANEVLIKCANTLKQWLVAQLIAMAVVGILTGLGLILIGLPLAFILGVIAGLLAFIPNIGPLLALMPAVLLAIAEEPSMVLWVLAVYLSVQALESYLITPMIQQEKVNLPPAFLIGMQLLFGVMFGLLGLALAMPLTALLMTLTREVYIDDYLEHEDTPKRLSSVKNPPHPQKDAAG